MKRADVPQDGRPEYGGERRALYALDERGHYTVAPSAGWTADATVNDLACEEYARLAAAALQRARAGETSPLEFHMDDRRMEVESLAPTVGLWRWRVRRHLKPRVFAALPAALLARYADALGIPVSRLTALPPP